MKNNFTSIKLANGRLLACAIRLSKKAKRILLQLSAKSGLTIVLPTGLNIAKVDFTAMLAEKQNWIENSLTRFAAKPKENTELTLPESIYLPALDETWAVFYIKAGNIEPKLQISNNKLCIYGGQINSICICLQNWLLYKARQYFTKEVERICTENNFVINKVSVKKQKSRWGSCSSRKNISLNCKLLLMPKEMINYIIIHELCHLRYMNHGAEFYNYLAEYIPNYKKLDKDLILHGRNLPLWCKM